MSQEIDLMVKKWLDCEDVPNYLKIEIEHMSDEEKKVMFGQRLKFGTAGMRGILAPGPNGMNELTVARATIGYKLVLLDMYKNTPISIVIAHDNRKNSELFANIAKELLIHSGIKVIYFDSLRPTPLLSFAIRYYKAQGGIVITASHNPKEYNGYKIYNSNGYQITESMANRITESINLNPDLPPYYGEVGDVTSSAVLAENDVEEEFLRLCRNCQLNRSEKKNIKIVYTPQHGTGSVFAVRLLEECGYEVIPVKEQMTPDPEFSNTTCANPEKIEAYKAAIELAKNNSADLIFCTDPDADRLGVMVKQKNDEYRLLTGNEVGTLLINYLLSERQRKAILPRSGGILFQSIVTSSLGSKIAEKYDVRTESFLTGFKYIGEAVTSIELYDPSAFQFGYEESCGYLVKDFCRDKDSFETMVVVAEMTNHYKLKGFSLEDKLDQIYQEYGYIYNHNAEKNFKLSEAYKIDETLNTMRKNMPLKIGQFTISKVEDYLQQETYDPANKKVRKPMTELPMENVIKLFLEDNKHWIAIRPSGTEPKIKFYYETTGNNIEEAKEIAKTLNQEINKMFN
ncbi:MAG TPA: phosphoglucomutase [Firmicutes bacterium]|nr:phosphoglucomutase [Bacillota bacterium]